MVNYRTAGRQRKIRFEDDGEHKSDEDEKDTRLKYSGKPSGVSMLQLKMLKMAGQQLPSGADVPVSTVVCGVNILFVFSLFCFVMEH